MPTSPNSIPSVPHVVGPTSLALFFFLTTPHALSPPLAATGVVFPNSNGHVPTPTPAPPASSPTPVGLEEKRLGGGMPARRWGRWEGGFSILVAVEAARPGRGGTPWPWRRRWPSGGGEKEAVAGTLEIRRSSAVVELRRNPSVPWWDGAQQRGEDEEDDSSSSGGHAAVAPARGSRRLDGRMACQAGQVHELGAPSPSDTGGVETVEAVAEGDLLRSPPILHASKSPIGEWKALEMENAVL
jgi:hypothetical protein